MKILFLDESGNHSLDKIDPQYPIFVLGGIVVDEEYAKSEIEGRVCQFKLELFGRDDIILHTSDIARNRNGYEKLVDPSFRQRFYERLNDLMQELQYTVIACAIRKDKHLARYGLAALDPYMLSLDVLVERFCFEIGNINDAGRPCCVANRTTPARQAGKRGLADY